MFWNSSEIRLPPVRCTFALAGLVFMSLFLAGCLSMQVPDNFLEDKSSREGLKALSPEEAKLWVREFEDDDQGSFEFWAEALRKELVDNRGYVLIEEREVKDQEENQGQEYLFEMTVQGIPHRYSITLFVLEGWFSNTIRVAEFVAEKKVFDGYLADVRESVKTIRS